MTQRFYAVLLISLVLLLSARLSLACGPFTLEAIFVFKVHPEYPLDRFSRGELGVVQPTFARSYLYVAYRHLSGIGLSVKEQEAVKALWRERLTPSWDLGERAWLEDWSSARAKVPEVGQPLEIKVYRFRDKPNEWERYLNCQKDSFAQAISTLESRIAKFGVDSAVVRDWVGAQDQVFANCGEGQHILSPANADADPLVQADRAYQIAAANFYAGNLDEARRLFALIAEDKISPWRETASYLVARTLVRQASLGSDDKKKEKLSEAEEQLNRTLSDSNLKNLHEPAGRLLNLVRLRLRPEIRLHELAKSLLGRDQEGTLKQDLWDYTVLLNQFAGEEEPEPGKFPDALRGDDLTDWIITLQSTEPEALEHSLRQWRVTKSTPWLVAALTKLDGKDPRADALLAQTQVVQTGSPAFSTVALQRIRLAISAGRTDKARTQLDKILKEDYARFNTSSQNQLRGMRMALAESLDVFLRYAQRQPAGLSWDDDGRQIPSDLNELEESRRSIASKALFDSDATQVLNRGMPLSLLKQAVRSPVLPEHLRRDVAQATWLRAVVLGDYKTADDVAPVLKSLVPETATQLDRFVAARTPEQKMSIAIYTWLKTPGLEPVCDMGLGRESPLGNQDSYRDNWWCSAAFLSRPADDAAEGEPAEELAPFASPPFITPSQREVAQKEWDQLTSSGAAPNYLCRQAIQWAARQPRDPRVSEALHLAVMSTRYGCTDTASGRWSKAAFDLLHRQYKNSVWAKRTPYWFKD